MNSKSLFRVAGAGLVATALVSPLGAHAGTVCSLGPDCLKIGLAEPTDSLSVGTVSGPTASGTLGFSGAFGTFTSITVNATGSPTLPQPDLTTTSVTVNGGATTTQTLDIFITEQNITGPLGVDALLSSFSATSFVSPTSSVTEDTFVDPSDGLYANALTNTAILLSTTTFTSTGINTATKNSPNLTGQYSETAEYIITVNGNTQNLQGSFSGGVKIQGDPPSSVPEPGSLALLGAGLAGFGLVRRWRRDT